MGMDKNPRLPKGVSDVGAGARGQLLGQRRSLTGWRVCSVWDYSPQSQTYSIVDGGAGIVHDIQRLVGDPGEVGLLPKGTQVVVHNELGFPVIAAVLKGSATSAVEVNPARVSEIRGVGGEDGVYERTYASADARSPNDPVDVIADDWIRKGQSNNMMGVLAGGTNVMSSSPMAQVRTHSVNHMVEIMANVYRHISSMGDLNIINDGGKTSLIWRAGADQLTECGPNADNWTLRLDAGATGDLFRFSITTPNNNTLCEIHMSADGRLSLTGVAGVDISSGTRGTSREDVAANKDVSVRGEMLTVVGGKVTEEYQASRETLVAQNDTLSAGNDLKEVIGHDRITQVANKLETHIEGSVPVAVLWDARNGSIESVTGMGALPGVKHAQTFVNYSGGFNFAIQGSAGDGKFNVVSNMPDSVVLGADGAAVNVPGQGHNVVAIATRHAMLFEPFADMMTTLLQWLDGHVHLSAMGPTGPAAAGPLGPISLPITAKLFPIKSIRVVIGA